MVVTPLPTRHGTLRLHAEADGWTRLTYTPPGGDPIDLGAEADAIIRSRLAGVALPADRFAAGETLDGRPVGWLLSLAERHASLYRTLDPAPIRVYVRDESGAECARFDLSADDVAAWKTALGQTGG